MAHGCSTKQRDREGERGENEWQLGAHDSFEATPQNRATRATDEGIVLNGGWVA
jgi:hypothetical protein